MKRRKYTYGGLPCKRGYDRHHILPVRLGGTDTADNIAYLTKAEHAIAHLWLYNIHRDRKDYIAFLGLAGTIGKEEIIRQARIAAAKGNQRCLGREISQETRDRISAANKGRELSQEHRDKISAALKGKQNCLGNTLSQEHKDKISAARKAQEAAKKAA